MDRTWKCTVCGYMHEGAQPPDACPQCGAFKYQFILYEALPEALENSLKEAFAGESKAHVRNLAFASVADREDLPEVSRLFRAVAEAERVHAAEYLKYLEGVVSDSETNLKTAFEHEIDAHTRIYPPLIKQAFDLKREDVAWSFIRARDVEDRHAKLYKQALTALVMGEPKEYHVCQVCGYVFEGDVPDTCPVCAAKKEKFKAIE
jgi:rubrerythrin